MLLREMPKRKSSAITASVTSSSGRRFLADAKVGCGSLGGEAPREKSHISMPLTCTSRKTADRRRSEDRHGGHEGVDRYLVQRVVEMRVSGPVDDEAGTDVGRIIDDQSALFDDEAAVPRSCRILDVAGAHRALLPSLRTSKNTRGSSTRIS
jgi:hypothetical protein